MIARRHDEVETHGLPGLRHQTLAGPGDGLRGLEVWYQRIAPGAETPWHRHECEEAVVVLAGAGRCETAGESVRFVADSTLIVPPGVVHRIVNDGGEELVLLASLSTAPVVVEAPDRSEIPLPWSA